VLKDLKKLDKDSVKNIISKIETDLAENADQQESLKGEFKGLRKYRIGNYRIIFAIIEKKVLILRIADRKEVYRSKI
jgi:mRNA interferase RelE/StbE